MSASNHERAMANPTTHTMVRPGEYSDEGPLDMPAGSTDAAWCSPSGAAADGSAHVLRTPAGNDTRVMLWRADHEAWSAHGHRGRRMAFPAAYLAAHGWRYVGPHVGALE